MAEAVSKGPRRPRALPAGEAPPGGDPPAPGGRTPPHDEEAERAVLGSLLHDNEAVARAAERLRPTDFFRPAHQAIFQGVLEIAERGEPVDLVVLQSELRKTPGLLERVGGVEALDRLMGDVPTAAHLDYYAGIVREKSILRHLLQATFEIQQRVYAGDEEAEALLDRAEQAIFEIAEKRKLGEAIPLENLMEEIFRKIDAIGQGGSHYTGLRTGFRDLDDRTSGLQKSELIVLAARPSMGKTSLALNIALHAALGDPAHSVEPIPVALFSLEMSAQQIAQNLLCIQSGVDSQKIRRGFLGAEDGRAFNYAISTLSKAQIFLDDSPSLTPLSLRAKARRLRANPGVGLVIVDYLQLMDSPISQDSRQQEVSLISRALKGLARELAVPILAVSQLSRAVENREEHRPRMSDLRESGAIEQDADVILLLWRDDYYTGKDPGLAHLSVAKQRNGPTGDLRLAFAKECMRFSGYSELAEPGSA